MFSHRCLVPKGKTMPFYNVSETDRLAENISAIRTIMPEVLARERELASSK